MKRQCIGSSTIRFATGKEGSDLSLNERIQIRLDELPQGLGLWIDALAERHVAAWRRIVIELSYMDTSEKRHLISQIWRRIIQRKTLTHAILLERIQQRRHREYTHGFIVQQKYVLRPHFMHTRRICDLIELLEAGFLIINFLAWFLFEDLDEVARSENVCHDLHIFICMTE